MNEILTKGATKRTNFIWADSETTSTENYEQDDKVKTLVVGGIANCGSLAGDTAYESKIESNNYVDFFKKIFIANRLIIQRERLRTLKTMVYFHNWKFDSSFCRYELRKINPTKMTYERYYQLKPLIRYLQVERMYASVIKSPAELYAKIKHIAETKTDKKGKPVEPPLYDWHNQEDLAKIYNLMQHLPWLMVDMIGSLGQIYQSIVFDDMYMPIIIRDSLKVYNTSIRALGETFGIPKLVGDWDYKKYRDENWKMTDKEALYFWHDIEILQAAMLKYLSRMNTKIYLTNAGEAYESLQDKINSLDMRNGDFELSSFMSVKDKEELEKRAKAKGIKNMEQFDYLMPETDLSLRYQLMRAYIGGVVGIPRERIEGKEYLDIKKKGIVLDVNSEYPAAMREGVYPVGLPSKFKQGKYIYNPKRPLCFQFFRAKFSLKNKTDRYHIAFLPKKWSKYNDYVYSDKELKESYKVMCLTSVDLKNFFLEYDVHDIEYIGYYDYIGAKDIFAPYVNQHAAQKEQASKDLATAKDSGDTIKEEIAQDEKNHAKIMLNSPYGRYVMKVMQQTCQYDIDGNGVQHIQKLDYELSDGNYCEDGIFITSYARDIFLRGARAAGLHLCYYDTDSIHLDTETIPEQMNSLISGSEIGKWKVESEFNEARYVRPKCYVEMTKSYKKDGSIYYPPLVKCAGLDDNGKKHIKAVTDLKYTPKGETGYDGVLLSKSVRGGTLLYNGSKRISKIVRKDKEHWKDEYMDDINQVKVEVERLISNPLSDPQLTIDGSIEKKIWPVVGNILTTIDYYQKLKKEEMLMYKNFVSADKMVKDLKNSKFFIDNF